MCAARGVVGPAGSEGTPSRRYGSFFQGNIIANGMADRDWFLRAFVPMKQKAERWKWRIELTSFHIDTLRRRVGRTVRFRDVRYAPSRDGN